MQTIQKFAKETAKKFSVDDWIGLIEVVINAFKECRENRLNKQQIKSNVRFGGGVLQKLRLRREIKRNMDRTNLNLRQVNAVADYMVDAALNPAREPEFDKVIEELEQAERLELGYGDDIAHAGDGGNPEATL